MYKYLILATFICVVIATDDDAHATVHKDYKHNDGKGHFEYGYDLTNGIGVDEAGDEHAVQGEFHFVSKEGVPVKISYTADAEGFHPHGDLLPTPPPVPEAIKKALAYIEAHPPKATHDHEHPHEHHAHHGHH